MQASTAVLVQQPDALEPAFPEVPGAVVLAVGTSSDRFLEQLVEPADAGQAVPPASDLPMVGDDRLEIHGLDSTRVGGAACGLFATVQVRRVQLYPAAGDLEIREPAGRLGIGLEDQVQVVAHDRVGAGLDGEDVQQLGEPLLEPLAAVVVLVTAEKGPADASTDAVVEAGRRRVDDAGARVSHAGLQRPELIVSAARCGHVTCSDRSTLPANTP